MKEIFYTCLILLPLGISLRMSLRLLYGVRGPQVDDPIHLMMSVAATVLTLAPIIVFIFITTFGFGFFLLIILASAGLEMIIARRAMQRHAVWGLVSEVFTGRVQSSLVLGQHQNRFTGIVGRAYRRLLVSLDQGVDLRTAIGLHRKALPEEAQAYAAINAIACKVEIDDTDRGKENNNTRRQIANQWDFVESQLANTIRQLSQRFTYFITVLFIMFGIVTFLMIKIVPSFVLIFEDFELELPQITISLIAASSVIVDSPFSAIAGLGFLLFLFLSILIALCYLCDVPVLKPFTDRLFFTRHRASILRLLAVAAECGKPFAGTCEQLIGDHPRYPSPLTRFRLTKVHREISVGCDWKDALRQGSFINKSDIPILETAQNVGNLPWVLRTLANQKMQAMVFRWSAVEQIAYPCVVLMIGLVVMWICVALFLPLVDLINGLV